MKMNEKCYGKLPRKNRHLLVLYHLKQARSDSFTCALFFIATEVNSSFHKWCLVINLLMLDGNLSFGKPKEWANSNHHMAAVVVEVALSLSLLRLETTIP